MNHITTAALHLKLAAEALERGRAEILSKPATKTGKEYAGTTMALDWTKSARRALIDTGMIEPVTDEATP